MVKVQLQKAHMVCSYVHNTSVLAQLTMIGFTSLQDLRICVLLV